MWGELLLFLAVIGIAVQQLYSVSKAQKETAAKEAASSREKGDGSER